VCLQSGHHQKRGYDISVSNAMGPPSKVQQGVLLLGLLLPLTWIVQAAQQFVPAQPYCWSITSLMNHAA
jgi:hypothetical protein